MLTTQWYWLYPTIIAVCWGGCGLVWVVGAIYNFFKAPPVQKSSGSIPAWIIGIVLALGVGIFVSHRFWLLLTFDNSWLRAIGIACLIIATGFTIWARWVLGTMWTASAVAKVDHTLHTDGPYGITRHPIYIGLLGMLFGTMLMSGLGQWVFFFLAGVVVLEAKIFMEERLLTEILGEKYVRYKQRVPQLIPGLQWLNRRHMMAVKVDEYE